MPYKVTWEPHGAYTRLTEVVTGNCLLQNINGTNHDIKVAVVADNAPAHAMWARLLKLGITPYPPAIHRDVAAARKWIDADADAGRNSRH